MSELTKTGDQSVLYSVLITLVNLCNAYNEQEHIPEMIELTEFADQYLPEEHDEELDDDNFEKRFCALAKVGVISALMNLAKTDSRNIKELTACVFNLICASVREIIVQQGGSKTLLSLALDGTNKGKKEASEGLVKLALTIPPEVAFPGQMMMEVVRPIINLKPERPVHENDAILIVLCHLATVNDSMREHMIKEGVFQKIEAFLYEEDNTLKYKSLTLLYLLFISREAAIQYFEQDNSRVKHLILLCKEEDQEIKFAAAGTLMTLTAANKKACEKVLDSNF
ncbi:protein unc-45 homolog B-like [Temnothorax longispinosus]|uniref:protein unc-45 homolog B-like n=1 Tax=Temnothorax longispinosus TaxID=300112 RepID=UPI003A996CB0